MYLVNVLSYIGYATPTGHKLDLKKKKSHTSHMLLLPVMGLGIAQEASLARRGPFFRGVMVCMILMTDLGVCPLEPTQ